MKVKITGFDKLQGDLKDTQRVFHGTITALRFNPDDSEDARHAVRKMEADIDSKTALYPGNALVVKVAEGLKDKCREKILERVRTVKR